MQYRLKALARPDSGFHVLRHAHPVDRDAVRAGLERYLAAPAWIEVSEQRGYAGRAAHRAGKVARSRTGFRIPEREIPVRMHVRAAIALAVVRKLERQFDDGEVVVLQRQRQAPFQRVRLGAASARGDREAVRAWHDASAGSAQVKRIRRSQDIRRGIDDGDLADIAGGCGDRLSARPEVSPP